MAKVTRASLLRAIKENKVAVHKIDGAEWPGLPSVYARSLSGTDLVDAQRLESGIDNSESPEGQMKVVAIWCAVAVCDEHGARYFENTDVDALIGLPFRVLARCSEAIAKFNGLTQEGESESTKSTRQPAKAVRVRSRKGTRVRRP